MVSSAQTPLAAIEWSFAAQLNTANTAELAQTVLTPAPCASSPAVCLRRLSALTPIPACWRIDRRMRTSASLHDQARVWAGQDIVQQTYESLDSSASNAFLGSLSFTAHALRSFPSSRPCPCVTLHISSMVVCCCPNLRACASDKTILVCVTCSNPQDPLCVRNISNSQQECPLGEFSRL
ncbi:hypothetical protein BDU57DRAFT_182019 [Ampelomyces quisqualis]|uniref:Uncharacterized protein n=1 Tax=Ampelomyces quisqualis TaxID=50730 RepID=A0A6A5QVP9_AMPQU|nr:hypothetical protein BDU57DRAFT_182019 [Ampelomyces quisqualis]